MSADLLVTGAEWLITLDRERRIIRNGAVAISGGRIVAVGKSAKLVAAYPDASHISARGMVYDNQTRQMELHANVRGIFEAKVK